MKINPNKSFNKGTKTNENLFIYNHFLFFCFIIGAFLLGLFSPAYALSIITTKEIDANLPNGAIESRVVLGKRVFKVEAHGFYFRNNATNSIDIEITSLLRDNQSFPLTSSAKTSLKIPPNAKIKKSTLLVLKGENAEEVAKILGISKEEYQKLENTAQTNATNDPMYANTPFNNNPNSPNDNAINGKDGANGSNGYGANGNDGIKGNDGVNGSSGSDGNNSNNNAIGSGIDTDGVLGVDGVNGSNSSSGGSVGGYENNFTNHGSTNNNTGGYDNFNNNSSSGGGLGNGGFSLFLLVMETQTIPIILLTPLAQLMAVVLIAPLILTRKKTITPASIVKRLN